MTTQPTTTAPAATVKEQRRTRRPIEYPDSDGKPMAESDLHRQVMVDLIAMLQRWFRDREDVYVSGNILVYYVEGDPRRSVAPDVLVIKGVPSRARRVVKLWEEGRAPQVVFEVTSQSTRREDTGRKRRLYAELGVREYYLYDPTADYLDPPLLGLELGEGNTGERDYREMSRPSGKPSYVSAELGLEVTLREDGSLGLRDPATGTWLQTPAEVEAALTEAERLRTFAEAMAAAEARARQEAEARADAEARDRALLQREVARLRALLAARGAVSDESPTAGE